MGEMGPYGGVRQVLRCGETVSDKPPDTVEITSSAPVTETATLAEQSTYHGVRRGEYKRSRFRHRQTKIEKRRKVLLGLR